MNQNQTGARRAPLPRAARIVAAVAAVVLLGACSTSRFSYDDDVLANAGLVFGVAETDQARLLRGRAIVGTLGRYGARTIGDQWYEDPMQAQLDAGALKAQIDSAIATLDEYRRIVDDGGERADVRTLRRHFPMYARSLGVHHGRRDLVQVAVAALEPQAKIDAGVVTSVVTGGRAGLLRSTGQITDLIRGLAATGKLGGSLICEVRRCITKVDVHLLGKDYAALDWCDPQDVAPARHCRVMCEGKGGGDTDRAVCADLASGREAIDALVESARIDLNEIAGNGRPGS
jgi:hypothetical protein